MKAEVKIVVTNIEVVRNFIFLVEKYFDELPDELKKSILEIEKQRINKED